MPAPMPSTVRNVEMVCRTVCKMVCNGLYDGLYDGCKGAAGGADTVHKAPLPIRATDPPDPSDTSDPSDDGMSNVNDGYHSVFT